MKKVIIRCFSNYSLLNTCHIIIFDECNNKVFNQYTKCGRVELYLNKGSYKILLAPFDICSSMLLTSFIVINKINYFDFCLKKTNNSLKITAILVDKNFDNLPIERGEIKLWQDHIQ